MAGKPCRAPSSAAETVPLAMMKPSVQLKPTLMPLTTASTLVGSRWAMAMLTQSEGVPSTVQVGQPKPWSAAADCTARWRVLEAPVQLCSVRGATT
jgi:hypothetical protein